MAGLPTKVVSADVLCIGGGIAGLMAAIRAGELGAKVVVADKSNTKSSGDAGTGCDHFQVYIPEIHGNDPGPVLATYLESPVVPSWPEYGREWIAKSFEMVKLWESWGIPMKYKGKYEFSGHAIPGKPCVFMRYEGGNQKTVLTKQALKRGAEIMNRVTVFELLMDKDRVIGAIGFDTKNDRLIEFHAKAVFMGTGGCSSRLYPGSTPGWMFNIPFNPSLTGDGRAMLYRAGGELIDLEFTRGWAGPKYYARCGKGSWIGVYRGPDDKPVGPFITRPDKYMGDTTADCWHDFFDQYALSGRGPVYNDVRGASDEDIEYMLHWLRNEGNNGFLDYLQEEGIDLRKNPVEFRTYELGVKGGIRFNVRGETSLKGLFSGGDECSTSVTAAVILGWNAGESSARYAKKADFGNVAKEKGRIDEKADMLEEMLGRKEGAGWREANIALQQIMSEYAGYIRSDSLLEQGLRNLGRLKEKARKTLVARNGHELRRCLEVFSLLDVGEAVMLCASERRETRASHKRTDYPFTNPLLDKSLTIKRADDKPVFEWREVV